MLLNKLATGPFWYLYMYLGLLLIMPFIRAMITGFTEQHYLVLFSMYIVVYGVFHVGGSFFPQLKLSSYFLDIFFNPYLIYVIAGYYIHFKLQVNKSHAKVVSFIFLMSIGAQTLLTYLYHKFINAESYLFLDYPKSAFVGIAAACLFYLSKCLLFDRDRPNKLITNQTVCGKIILQIGSCTFGIYIFSNYVIHRFNKDLFPLLVDNFHILIAAFIFNIFVFAFAFFITYVLKRVPIINKYL